MHNTPIRPLSEAEVNIPMSGAMRQAIGHVNEYLSRRLDSWVAPSGVLEQQTDELRARAYHVLERMGPESAQDVQDIVISNRLRGTEITPTLGAGPQTFGMMKGRRLLEIYEGNANVAILLAERSIAGFHGSRSGSLMNVLRHGLLSADEARSSGIQLVSGERTFSRAGGQQWISFADWTYPDTIRLYTDDSRPLDADELMTARNHLQSQLASYERIFGSDHLFVLNARQRVADMDALRQYILNGQNPDEIKLLVDNFPVAYGINIRGYKIDYTSRGVPLDQHAKMIRAVAPSDKDGEFMVWGKRVAPDEIGVIAVPNERVAEVQDLVARFGHDIKVISLEDLVAQPFRTSSGLTVENRARQPEEQRIRSHTPTRIGKRVMIALRLAKPSGADASTLPSQQGRKPAV